jgi:hypothetical protein
VPVTVLSRRIKDMLKRRFANLLRPHLDELEQHQDRHAAQLSTELAESTAKSTALIQRQIVFVEGLRAFRARVCEPHPGTADAPAANTRASDLGGSLRKLVREGAGVEAIPPDEASLEDLLAEFQFTRINRRILGPALQELASRRVLFAGQAYYNAWYLSRALRERGWVADVLNWDTNPASQIHYHGEDFRFTGTAPDEVVHDLRFYLASLYAYDVFHFSNAHGICFGFPLQALVAQHAARHAEITLLKDLGKKIVYGNNGCLDGVSQTSFAQWGPESVCSICVWKNHPEICSDERNLSWGRFRNAVSDYQCLSGGNRVDFNDDPRVHEVPEFYCLDTDVWQPQLVIPDEFRVPSRPEGTIRLYHAVGNRVDRTADTGANIKSSHLYLPLIEKLRAQGLQLELLEPTGIPNKQVRFFQAQADIFLDMLTYGWFGATAREAMMLGKPVICYIRPEWLASVREEIADYADELPIISATPGTIEDVLRDLIANPEKRRRIGERSRAFAVKWHSGEAGGRRFDEIYSKLLREDPLLRVPSRAQS